MGTRQATSDEARRAAARWFGAEMSADSEYLALAVDQERSLGTLAAHDVEMLLSCGAYWQVLLRALASQGWEARRLGFNDHDGDGDRLFGRVWQPGWSLLSLVELRYRGSAASGGEPLGELRATAGSDGPTGHPTSGSNWSRRCWTGSPGPRSAPRPTWR